MITFVVVGGLLLASDCCGFSTSTTLFSIGVGHGGYKDGFRTSVSTSSLCFRQNFREGFRPSPSSIRRHHWISTTSLKSSYEEYMKERRELERISLEGDEMNNDTEALKKEEIPQEEAYSTDKNRVMEVASITEVNPPTMTQPQTTTIPDPASSSTGNEPYIPTPPPPTTTTTMTIPEQQTIMTTTSSLPPSTTKTTTTTPNPISSSDNPKPLPSPDRAMGIVAELKASAALFAAFAFGALNLPGTLILSESRITSASSSISTSRPVPDSDLLQAFVVLDAATFGFMLICVVVSQQLIYQLSDGSYGLDENNKQLAISRNEDGRESALGRLVTQYAIEFSTARTAFGLGIVSILLATIVKTWAVFDSSIAVPVTVVIGLSSIVIGVFNLRVNDATFKRLTMSLPEDKSSGINRKLLSAIAAASILSVCTLAYNPWNLRPFDSPGVTADIAFQRLVKKMEKAGMELSNAEKAMTDAAIAESAAVMLAEEAQSAARRASAEKVTSDGVAAEKTAIAARLLAIADDARVDAKRTASERTAAVDAMGVSAAAAEKAAAIAKTSRSAVAEKIAIRERAEIAASTAKIAEEKTIETARIVEEKVAKSAQLESQPSDIRIEAENARAELLRASATQTTSAQALAEATQSEYSAIEAQTVADAAAKQAQEDLISAQSLVSLTTTAAERLASALSDAETIANLAAGERTSSVQTCATKSVAEKVSIEQASAADRAAKKATSTRIAAEKVLVEKTEAEKAAGVPMRVAADKAQAERLMLRLTPGGDKQVRPATDSKAMMPKMEEKERLMLKMPPAMEEDGRGGGASSSEMIIEKDRTGAVGDQGTVTKTVRDTTNNNNEDTVDATKSSKTKADATTTKEKTIKSSDDEVRAAAERKQNPLEQAITARDDKETLRREKRAEKEARKEEAEARRRSVRDEKEARQKTKQDERRKKTEANKDGARREQVTE